jgi:hypothetical protein
MEELNDLSRTAEGIATDLDALSDLRTGVGDIQEAQEDTDSNVSLNTLLLIVAIVLLIVLIVVGIMLLSRGRGSYRDRME